MAVGRGHAIPPLPIHTMTRSRSNVQSRAALGRKWDGQGIRPTNCQTKHDDNPWPKRTRQTARPPPFYPSHFTRVLETIVKRAAVPSLTGMLQRFLTRPGPRSAGAAAQPAPRVSATGQQNGFPGPRISERKKGIIWRVERAVGSRSMEMSLCETPNRGQDTLHLRTTDTSPLCHQYGYAMLLPFTFFGV